METIYKPYTSCSFAYETFHQNLSYSFMTSPDQEIVSIVNRDNKVIDAQPRSVMRSANLIHRAAYILVFNNNRELFLQKRSIDKDVFPGYWDIAAGGVVLANESYEVAASRELAEELGVTGVSLAKRFDHYYEGEDTKVWGRVFTCFHPGPFILQKEEIDFGQFLSVEEVLKLAEREPVTPDGLQILLRLEQLDHGETI